MDVTIIETSGNATGSPATAEELLDAKTNNCIAGPGWIGTTSTLSELDGDRKVFRLAARLAAMNTIMSCYISYVASEQADFAADLLQGITYCAST